MHLNMLVRKRFFIYVQISIFFVGAIYLLSRQDGLPVPASWGIPHYVIDSGLVDPLAGQPAASNGDGAGYKVADLPSSVPAPEVEPEEWETLYDAGEAHNDEKQDSEGEQKAEGQHAKGDAATDRKEQKAGHDGQGKVANEDAEANTTTPATTEGAAHTSPTPSPTITTKLTKQELQTKALSYIPSILDPNNTSIDRMYCPPINRTRYAYLQPSTPSGKPQYFIALNLRKCVDLLPRLLGSLIQTISFLGPSDCAVSIVEGNSDDGTLEVLELLKQEFQRLGVHYYLRSATLDPSAGNRIQKLAMLRAMAVAPVTGIHVPDIDPDSPDFPATPSSVPRLSLADDATVLFLNDVAACPDDMLELFHQRLLQKADMTCAMDWTHPGPDPLFYDVWVSRALNGDLFFDIPTNPVSWDNATNLFWNESVARGRLAARKPFQVFACWNGAVAFTAAPLVQRQVSFRSSVEGECFQGEPQLFCKDMWYNGYGRIAVVPSVNLEYTDKLGRQVKREKGYVGEWIADEHDEKNGTGLMIPWRKEPPAMVKCMPSFEWQSWMPWNESLPLNKRLTLVL